MNIFQKRIKRVQSELQRAGHASALVVSSAKAPLRSRDGAYPFRQNSDFFYLTGSQLEDASLLISTQRKTALLLAEKPSETKLLWEGQLSRAKSVAQSLGIESGERSHYESALQKELHGIEEFYFQNTPGTASWEIAQKLISRAPHDGGSFPRRFSQVEVLIEKMRLFKDKDEVTAVRAAAALTNEAILTALSIVQPGAMEFEVAALIEGYIQAGGGCPGFPSIVATGKNAAILHYRRLQSKLKAGELLLIDCGAELNMYNGDITRVIPVDGTFTPEQAVVYDTVLAAQKKALSKIKAGVLASSIQNIVAKTLTEGLIELGVLRGKLSGLLEKKAYRPYFPHGFGHSLGIDVHDVGNLRSHQATKLEAGMVITVEPGLYFSKKVGHAPVCGVRIEDDVLVTASGCEILSDGFPKERDELPRYA